MTPSDIRATRETLGLSAQDFAALLGVTTRTVYRWEDGTREIPEPTVRLLMAKLALHHIDGNPRNNEPANVRPVLASR